jgi:hypothetical protein
VHQCSAELSAAAAACQLAVELAVAPKVGVVDLNLKNLLKNLLLDPEVNRVQMLGVQHWAKQDPLVPTAQPAAVWQQ